MASVSQQIVENSNLTKINSASAAQETKKSLTSVSGDEFLVLLTEQLKYQDPTNPMDNNDMLAQEAQFQSLSQMEELTSSFSKFANIFQANSLMGQSVEITLDGKTTTGVVEYVDLSDEKGASISVGGSKYPMSAVTKIYPQGATSEDSSTTSSGVKEIVSNISDNIGDIAKKLSTYLGVETSKNNDTTTSIETTI